NSPQDSLILAASAESGSGLEAARLALLAGADPNLPDEQGMTPLLHAAFKARADLVALLVDTGKADVNWDGHEHGYTALMFAALSNSEPTVLSLLRRGARAYKTNRLGRTASQMAAFVGHHRIASLIGNYFEREELEHYTRCHGLETKPKLPPHLLEDTWMLVTDVNLNPAHLCYTLESRPALLNPAVPRVLELLSESQWKRRDLNEVLSIKFFYLAVAVRHLLAEWERCRVESGKDDGQVSLDQALRRLTQPVGPARAGRGSEELIRRVLREYPYTESNLLRTMIRSLASSRLGCRPTAVSVLNGAVNGQQFFADQDACEVCDKFIGCRHCAGCRVVKYCGPRCQRLNWPVHKPECAKLRQQRLKDEANNASDAAEAATKAELAASEARSEADAALAAAKEARQRADEARALAEAAESEATSAESAAEAAEAKAERAERAAAKARSKVPSGGKGGGIKDGGGDRESAELTVEPQEQD
ncbi:hypothetical protein BOX15_Mlig026372g1, partial [Macrostomum lignano]